MRDRMERFVLLPFSGGCVSHSSIATCDHQSRKPMKPDATPSPKGTHKDEEEEDGRGLGEENIKNSSRILSLPKDGIATSLQRLLKNVKMLSQIFGEFTVSWIIPNVIDSLGSPTSASFPTSAYRDEMEEDEEEEMEMQIGSPTDVKHVTHIGWNDSLATSNNVNSWDTFLHPTAPELDIQLLCNHQTVDP